MGSPSAGWAHLKDNSLLLLPGKGASPAVQVVEACAEGPVLFLLMTGAGKVYLLTGL